MSHIGEDARACLWAFVADDVAVPAAKKGSGETLSFEEKVSNMAPREEAKHGIRDVHGK